MKSQSMTDSQHKSAYSVLSMPVQLTSAVLLGIVILYGAGFVNTAAVHNAAHDTRHSQGFPCH